MRIKLIVVGKKMPNWVEQGYQEYAKRLPREISLELIEIPLAHRGKNPDIKRLMDKEGEQMLATVKPQEHNVALEVTGKAMTTEQLAKRLAFWQASGKDINLFVGGPDGLSPACQQSANEAWSLSPLTLPHPLVRVILAETLYRAWSVNAGHPYHRE
jgi:23S rRNA (pseudouridine1915-N3)-methyltransferase